MLGRMAKALLWYLTENSFRTIATVLSLWPYTKGLCYEKGFITYGLGM